MTDLPPIHPLVQLIRRFAIDWLDRAHAPTCEEIMTPEYRAVVGGVALEGRDDSYLPATLGQLDRFPGLLITVHDLFTNGEMIALRFSEHGASPDRGGASAAWAGVGIFGWDSERLTFNVTEEDYLARRRQLATGIPDQVATPATAPWTTAAEPADHGTEAVVRDWLVNGDLSADGRVAIDDGWTGQPTPPLVAPDDVEVDTLFSAGSRAAFHLTQRGGYRGGLDLPDAPLGTTIGLRSCGMVEVHDGSVMSGFIVRDRVGLRRDLLQLQGGT